MWLLLFEVLLLLAGCLLLLLLFAVYFLPLFIAVPRFEGRTRGSVENVELKESSSWRHEYLHTNGIRLHYVSAGNECGPLMLLLHGFPECWYSWRYQLKEFSKDYHVVALDMRGFNLSDKPQLQGDYHLDTITRDICGVIEALSRTTGECTLVGHDWGGIITWLVAHNHQELLHRVVVIDAAHPSKMKLWKTRNFTQMLKSWYIFFFQLSVLPEIFMSRNDFEAIEENLKSPEMGVKNEESVSMEDVEIFKDALAQPGALTGSLNYYRNMIGYFTKLGELPMLRVPTLILHGEEDFFIGKEMMEGLSGSIENLQTVILENCSHWANQDCWQRVNQEIRAFLKA